MPRRASGCRPEPAIIDALRSDGDPTLSLVASNDGVLVGHVAFPPITIGEFAHGWYGLGRRFRRLLPIRLRLRRDGDLPRFARLKCSLDRIH